MFDELVGWLCGAFGVCVIIGLFAALGHGLWLLAAMLVRAVAGKALRVSARCPNCKAELAPLDQARCLQCDWPRKEPYVGAELTPHREFAQRLVALWSSGRLDTAACKVVAHDLVQALDAAVVAQRRTAQAVPLPLVEKSPATVPDGLVLAEAVAAELVPDQPTIPLAPAESTAAQLFEKHRSVAERAAQYAARQAAQGLQPAAQPLPPPKPRKPWSQVLAGFMEERNIRWGELVGGLLIVCCSIALVISFWSEIAERPLVKFLVFNGVTAVLFVLGLYADRRWKLPSTSQGLLLTASLLTPLNFLAIAAFSRGEAPTSPFVIGGELVTIGLFAWLLWLAGRTLVAQAPHLLATGVLIPAASQLLVRRFVHPETGTLALFAVGLLPTLAFAGSTTALSVRRSEGGSRTDHAHQLLRLLGTALFAVLPPLGLLLVRSEAPGETLARLPSLLVLVGAPLAACGVSLQRDPLLKDGKLKVVGTSLAALGALAMLGSVVAGWPQPAGMVPAALLNFVLLTATALLFRSASAHLVAGPCFGLAYLLLVHVIRQTLAWQVEDAEPTVRAIVSAASGTALAPVAAIYAALALGLPAKAGTWQRVAFGGLALLAVGVSVALITVFGFRVPGDPHRITWIYALYAAALLGAANWLCRKKESARERLLLQALTWLGAALAVPACIQFACYAHPELIPGRHKLLAAWTGLTTLLAVVACVNGWAARAFLPAATTPAEVLRTAAKIASALAGALVAQAVVQGHYPEAAVCAGLLALAWLVFAWVEDSAALLAAGQCGAAAAAALAVGHVLSQRAWWAQTQRPWLDPWTWQAVGLALAGLNLLWVALRIVSTSAARRHGPGAAESDALAADVRLTFWQRAARLLAPPYAPADRVISALLVLGLTWLCTYAVLPGAAQEMSPRLFARSLPHVVPEHATPLPGVVPRVVPAAANFEFLGIAHAHAADYGSWLLGGVLLALLVLSLWTSYELLRVPALLLVLFLAAPLAAAQWEGQVAAGAALRWSSALAFFVISALIWARGRFARLAAALRCPLPPAPRSQLTAGVAAAVLLPLLPLAALFAFVCLAALQFRPVAGDLVALWQALAIVFFFGGILALALRIYSGSWAEAQRFWPREQFATLGRQAGNVLAVLCTLPLAAVTLFVVAAALQGNPVVGPEPASWFARIGTMPSYALPPLLLAVTLLGYALRERSAAFAYSSALVFNVSATAAYALFAAQRGLAAGPAFWVRIAQVNALVAALFALAWQTVRWRAARRAAVAAEPPREPLLASLAALAAALVCLPVVWAAGNLWWEADAGPLQQHVGDWGGWLALVVVAAAWWWVFRRRAQPLTFSPVALAFLGWGIAWQIAFSLTPWELGDLLVFRGVLIAQPLAGAAALALPWLLSARTRAAETSGPSPRGVVWPVVLLIACQTFWALRSLGENALVPWWTIAGLLLAAALACGVAARQTQRRYLAWALVLCFLATFCYWGHRSSTPPFNHLTALLALEAMTCAAFSLVCTALEVFCLQPRRGPVRRVPFQQIAGWISIAFVALCATSGIVGDFQRSAPIALAPFSLGALAFAAAAIGAGFWNPQARGNLVQSYVLGLAAVGIGVDLCNLPSKWLPWTGAIVLSAYTVATSFLFSRRRGLRQFALRVRIPRAPGNEASGLAWLVPLTLLLSLHVVALTAWSVLTLEELPMRLAAGKSAIAQLLAAGLLARGSRQTQLRYLALVLGAVGAILWAWAWQAPGKLDFPVLERLIAVVGALAATIAVYGLGIVRLLPRLVRWHRAARLLTPALVALAGVALFFILGAELWAVAEQRDLQLSWASKLTVLLALVGTTASALVAAVVPGRDPLGLSERGRTLYVYAAEALLALAVLHVRLTMPWLFRGTFQRYWPLLVVLTAFVGVGLSEVFRRQARRVLYEPLERTGAFLPLLPVVAFWLTPSGTHYSLLLVCVGLVYATLAVLRKSFGFGVLAALAANGGLWYLLAKQGGLGLLQHPQLWIIPPAACVLAAAYFNRKQLSEKEFVAVRYGAAIAIYTASTADVFLNGVAQAPWLPLVLAGLSLAGIFAGILLRVRAFLMLGTSFLLLALLTVIWHAAVDLEQTWLWYATGLVAGILIIAVFALFEKKRQEMLALLDKFKHWSA